MLGGCSLRGGEGSIVGVVRTDYLWQGFVLDLVYLALGIAVFQWTFHIARKRGLLLNAG